jgi:hypothetical protein
LRELREGALRRQENYNCYKARPPQKLQLFRWGRRPTEPLS